MKDNTVDSVGMGKLSFVPNQNAAKSHSAGNHQTYRPLKKIISPDSMTTTAKRLRSTTGSS